MLPSTFLQTLYPERFDGAHRAVATRRFDPKALPDYPQSDEDTLAVIASLPQAKHDWSARRPFAVILAGGKGSRMGGQIPQKSLSLIGGKPALARTMQTCLAQGIADFIIVVGFGYKHVVGALETFPARITFLFQDQPMGTGHAARFASRYLCLHGFSGDALILMGDKWIQPGALQRLRDDHERSQADLTITAGKKEDWPDSGRLVMNGNGGILAIVEKPDIVRSQLIEAFLDWPHDPVGSQAFIERALAFWNRKEKILNLLGEAFWNQLHIETSIAKANAALPNNAEPRIQVNGQLALTGKEIEGRCAWVNLSVYWMRSECFYDSMERLKADNAQCELYLTDAVHDLTSCKHDPPCRVAASAMPGKRSIMGFNTPEELAEIEAALKEATPDEM